MPERLRITEARLALQEKTGVRVTNVDIADAVFSDPRGQGYSESRKKSLLSRWDNGHEFGQITPGRLLRLAAVLKVNVADLLEA